MRESLADDLLSGYEDRERIPLRELGERLGLSADARSRAVKAGAIRTAGRAGLGGGYVIDEDEARRLIKAAIIAAAGGLAVLTVLRVLGAGAA